MNGNIRKLKNPGSCWFIIYTEELSKVKVAQLCPALCNPMDYTLHGLLQATVLEWVAFPSPGDLPNPGIEYRSPALQADSLPAEPLGKLTHTPRDQATGLIT